MKASAIPPRYMELYSDLIDKLPSYPIGSFLPSEQALCLAYDADRFNVRKALAMLVEEGYVERRQGSGTRVLRHPMSRHNRVLFLLCQGDGSTDRLSEPFYAQSIDALEEQLQQADMHLIYCKILRGDNLLALCRDLDVQALILAGTPDAALLEQCSRLNLPTVGYNTSAEGIPCVTTDNDGGAAAIAQHLIRLGHRHLGVIHVPGYINSQKRLDRFKIEMRNAEWNTELHLQVIQGDWNEESGYHAAKKLLTESEVRPTAIFGGNDAMAIGAMRAAKELGLQVPQEISIVGYDGTPQSRLTDPPLTTAQVDVSAMAAATRMLLQNVMNNSIPCGVSCVVSAKLILRGTTSAPKEENL